MHDLCIGKQDLVNVRVGGDPVLVERGWSGSGMPSDFFGMAPGYANKVRGRLQGDSMTTPDRFIVGRWTYNGYLGAAPWDYEASGLSFQDNAVLLQWDAQMLGPGEARVIVTDYGLEINNLPPLSITCPPDTVHLPRAQSPDTEHRFAVSVWIKNDAGAGPAATLEAEAFLNPDIRFRQGAQALQQTVLDPGQNIFLTWQLASDLSSLTRQSMVRIVIRSRGAVLGECYSTISMPGMTLQLTCEPTIVVPDTVAGGFLQNPVTISATLRNTSPTPVGPVQCELIPDVALTLQPPYIVYSVPAILDAGQEATVTWQVFVPEHLQAQTYKYTIRCLTEDVQCEGTLEVPAVTPSLRCEQQNTTLGKEFWVAYPTSGFDGRFLIVYLHAVTQEKTRITIETGAGIKLFDTTAAAWTHTAFRIPGELSVHDPETVSNRCLRVYADRPIALMSSIDTRAAAEAATVFPAETLGKRYVMLAEHGPPTLLPDWDQLLLIGTEDNTQVSVIPSNITGSGKAAGVLFSAILNRGEILPVMSPDSGLALSGTEVTADKQIAAFAGTRATLVRTPSGGAAANPFYEQLPKEEDCGRTYIILPYRSRIAGPMYRVVALHDSTAIQKDGVPWAFLTQRGEVYEDSMMVSKPILLEGDKPFLAAQYSPSLRADGPITKAGQVGDPSMVFPPPVDAFASCHLFYAAPPRYDLGLRLIDPWDSVNVSIVAWAGAEDKVRLNGVPLPVEFVRMPGWTFSVAEMRLQPGVHRLSTDDPRGVYGMSYAFYEVDAYCVITSRILKPSGNPAGVQHAEAAPDGYFLRVAPNPVASSGSVDFQIPRSSHVRIECFDMLGRLRLVLLDASRVAGMHTLDFNVDGFSAGTYLIRLSAGDHVISGGFRVIR